MKRLLAAVDEHEDGRAQEGAMTEQEAGMP
jgi:hypothetical protein